jgi:1-deoxy-D-xylulose-5-phosphate synthase
VLLSELAQSHAGLLTIEDHALAGGFGAAVAESVVDLGLMLIVSRLGVRDELVPHAAREQQLAAQGLDRAGVAKRLRELLGLHDAQTIPFPRTG